MMQTHDGILYRDEAIVSCVKGVSLSKLCLIISRFESMPSYPCQFPQKGVTMEAWLCIVEFSPHWLTPWKALRRSRSLASSNTETIWGSRYDLIILNNSPYCFLYVSDNFSNENKLLIKQSVDIFLPSQHLYDKNCIDCKETFPHAQPW